MEGNLPGQAGGDSGHAALATGGILSGWERGLDGGNTLYKHMCHHDHHLPQHIVYINNFFSIIAPIVERKQKTCIIFSTELLISKLSDCPLGRGPNQNIGMIITAVCFFNVFIHIDDMQIV